MAHKVVIEHGDHRSAGKDILSAREYDEYTVTAIKQNRDDYYNRAEGVSLTFYVDAETGVVTTDVKKYEGRRWREATP